MKNKFVVYTALFGNYDDLIDPKEKYEGCDFICFTDQKHLTSDIWEIRLIEECDLPPNMMNRKYKILPHLFLSEYEWSLYVDANIAILGNPFELANKYLSIYDMAVPKHFARDCIYEEANIVLRSGRVNLIPTITQMKNYKNNGYFGENGLTENNIIFRKLLENDVIEAMILWWTELNKYEKRDQFSLGYVLWNKKINFIKISENARNNGIYFKHKKHKKEIFSLKSKIINFMFKFLPFYFYKILFLKCK